MTDLQETIAAMPAPADQLLPNPCWGGLDFKVDESRNGDGAGPAPTGGELSTAGSNITAPSPVQEQRRAA